MLFLPGHLLPLGLVFGVTENTLECHISYAPHLLFCPCILGNTEFGKYLPGAIMYKNIRAAICRLSISAIVLGFKNQNMSNSFHLYKLGHLLCKREDLDFNVFL